MPGFEALHSVALRHVVQGPTCAPLIRSSTPAPLPKRCHDRPHWHSGSGLLRNCNFHYTIPDVLQNTSTYSTACTRSESAYLTTSYYFSVSFYIFLKSFPLGAVRFTLKNLRYPLYRKPTIYTIYMHLATTSIMVHIITFAWSNSELHLARPLRGGV